MGSSQGVLAAGLGLAALLAASCSHAPLGPEAAGEVVRFHVEAPSARRVVLVILPSRSADRGIREYAATGSDSGRWSASLPLEPGEYRYFFLVDGIVRVSSRGSRVEVDDFGGITGVLKVYEEADGGLKVY